MKRLLFVFWGTLGLLAPSLAQAPECVECHRKATPAIVADWRLSRHSANEVTCAVCHGTAHSSAADAAKAVLPTPETCAQCHEEKVAQFKKGKHAAAWASVQAMPTIHAQPVAMVEGLKGCGGCHKIGLKTAAEIKALQDGGGGFGLASCDACHTRHTFSVREASEPQACQTCHMGFDHPQWEMYSASKHGVRYLLKQAQVLPASTPAPKCQTCHMKGGDHAVMTGWGFLAVRLPLPDDPSWAADRAVILQGLGVLDPQMKPTPRLDAVKAVGAARLTQEDWQKPREAMLAACSECHSRGFARGELEKGDAMIREADRLMAEAIRIVAALYKDGLLPKAAGYASAFPDLLTFHDAPSEIEQTLFVMFLEHRMRAFQGTFHANPDYALWYGWSELRRDLTTIQTRARELRAKR